MSMSHLYGTDGEDGVEMENFEVSDWDLQNEFNPHRQRHRQTKEEATYGVWAERDSDEERPSFGGKRYGPGAGGMDPPPPGRAVPSRPGPRVWRPPLVPRLRGQGSGAAPLRGGFQAVNAPQNSPAGERGGPRGGRGAHRVAWGDFACANVSLVPRGKERLFPGKSSVKLLVAF